MSHRQFQELYLCKGNQKITTTKSITKTKLISKRSLTYCHIESLCLGHQLPAINQQSFSNQFLFWTRMVVNYPQIIENNISCKFAVHSRSFAFQKVFPIIPVYSWQFQTVKKVFPIIPVHSWQFLTTKNIFLIAVQLLIIAVPPKTFMLRIVPHVPVIPSL